MKKIIQNITKTNIWLVNFTSCLAGTILGIVLTFGISAYIQEQERKELFVKTVDFSLSNIDRNLVLIKKVTEEAANRDALFQSIYKHYPRGASEVNLDSVLMCLLEFFNHEFNSIDNTAVNIFSNNIDTWKNSDNLELLEDIGDCFSLIDRFNYEKSRIDNLQDDFISHYLSSTVVTELANNPNKIAESFFETHGFQNYIIQHNIYTELIEMIYSELEICQDMADSTFCIELGLDPAVNTYLDSKYFD